jgi:sialidase-1
MAMKHYSNTKTDIVLIICSILFISSCRKNDEAASVVFRSGEDGYHSYRIPAIVKTPKGDLLAFCEGRVRDVEDFGNVDIVMKRSTDGGATWGALQKLADYDELQAGNPAPVVDVLDPAYPNGRIFLFYNTGDDHENELRKGNGLREAFYITSTDGGINWSEPVNITTQVHRPKRPQHNPAYNFQEDWRSYANTPGHAMQFSEGNYKGRIYIPANHSSGDPLDNWRDYHSHSYYSDDHGKTFQLSENVSFEGSNESMAAQIGTDELYMNSRNQRENFKARIVSRSSDGGVSWDTTFYAYELLDPINQASVLSFKESEKWLLAFCNAADSVSRDNLTLRLSRDGGNSWFFNKSIAKSSEGYTGDYAAYSDLVEMSPNEIGVLYEKDEYKQIVFERVKWN